LSIVNLSQRTGRTYSNTLTACNAGYFVEFKFKSAADMRFKASFVRTDNGNCLVLVTNRNAASAQNALVVVTDKMRHRSVFFVANCHALILVLVLYAVISAKLLELTFA